MSRTRRDHAMDSGDRFAPDALELFRRLAQAPESFGFFQVLRRVESTHRDQPRLGTTHRSAQEPVRLAQEPSLLFAPSTLAALEAAVGSRPPRLVSRFLGLFGPNGPLPLRIWATTSRARSDKRSTSLSSMRSAGTPCALARSQIAKLP